MFDKRLFWDLLIILMTLFFLIRLFKLLVSNPLQKILNFLILFSIVVVFLNHKFLNSTDYVWLHQHYEGIGVAVLFIGLIEILLIKRKSSSRRVGCKIRS